MPTLKKRVDELEKRVDGLAEKTGALENWLSDESKLREINEQQIELLKQADEIHERRLKALAMLAAPTK